MAEERTGKKLEAYDFSTQQATADELADAIITSGTQTCLTNSQLIGIPQQVEVFATPLQGFPTEGNEFAVLSSGIAAQAPGTATTFVSTITGGPTSGNFNDIIRLAFTFQLPANPGNLSVDWKFGTDENPTYTQSFIDKFEINVTTSGGTTNIARLPDNNPVNTATAAPFSNAPGGSSGTPTPPFPTPNDVTYNAVTNDIYTATIDLSAFAGETITVEFLVADFGDSTIDSAAFIDNLSIEGCELSITCPEGVTRSNDPGQCGAIVTFPDPTVTGGAEPISIECFPPSGTFFGVGVNPVVCTATDAAGNEIACTFTVTVLDSEPPTIACPEDIIVDNDPGECGARVNFTTLAEDNCPGVTFECTPPSGDFFELGTTPVSCTATDASGNRSICNFNVTVVDNEPPTITCPDNITVGVQQGQPGTNVSFPDPMVNDNCPGVAYSCEPESGSFFPIGINVVTCTAIDAAGNESSCSFTVTVVEYEVHCIRTPKVYDWIMDTNRYTNKTPLPGDPDDMNTCAGAVAAALANGDDLRFECTPPDLDSDDAPCEVLEAVPGSPTGTIRVLWTVFVNVTIFNDSVDPITPICTFDVPVQFDDEYAVCLPEPFSTDNVLCRITQVNCSVTNAVFLGNQIQVSVTVCKEVQVEEEVKLEALGKFCNPRPNDIPVDNGPVDECPGFEFPPQCPTIFPRPNCDCQAEAAIDTNVQGTRIQLDALICDNCTLSQSTWSFTQSNEVTGDTATVTPRTIDNVECIPTIPGGIQIFVTGLADVTGSEGDFTNIPYELVLIDDPVKAFSLDVGPITTSLTIDNDDFLVIQDCVTFGDIDFNGNSG